MCNICGWCLVILMLDYANPCCCMYMNITTSGARRCSRSRKAVGIDGEIVLIAFFSVLLVLQSDTGGFLRSSSHVILTCC